MTDRQVLALALVMLAYTGMVGSALLAVAP